MKYGDEINWSFEHFQISKSERLFYFDECVLSNSCIYFMHTGFRSQPSYNVNINING